MTVDELLDSLVDKLKAKNIAIEEAEKNLGRAYYQNYGWSDTGKVNDAYEELRDLHLEYDKLSTLDQSVREHAYCLEIFSKPIAPMILTTAEIASVNVEDIPF